MFLGSSVYAGLLKMQLRIRKGRKKRSEDGRDTAGVVTEVQFWRKETVKGKQNNKHNGPIWHLSSLKMLHFFPQIKK